MANIFNDFELLDFINLDEMMWEEGAVAPVTLTIQNAKHSLKSQNVSLAQANTLAVQSVKHAVKSSNVTISLASTLVLANAIHSLKSTNPDLIPGWTLSIANTIHTTKSGNVDLTQAHVLAIQNAIHELASTNPALVQNNIIAIRNTLHALLSGNVGLIQAFTLDILNTIHILRSSNIPLPIPDLTSTPYNVAMMEDIIRSIMNEPTQDRITSAEILRAINDGYMDVSAKALCIESRMFGTTKISDRRVAYSGHRVNWVYFGDTGRYYDKLIIYCTAAIKSGSLYIGTPTISDSDRWMLSCYPQPTALTISHELAAGKRSLFYTLDGTTPDNTDNLYNEVSFDATPLFDSWDATPSEPFGTIKTVKAVAYVPGPNINYSPVAERKYYKLGSFLYGPLEYWAVEHPIMEAGRIVSGVMTEIVVVQESYEDDVLDAISGEIVSGTMAEIVVVDQSYDGDTLDAVSGEIVQGHYWDPVVEIEPPWN